MDMEKILSMYIFVPVPAIF